MNTALTYPIIWSDLDFNGHICHISYNRYSTQARLDYLASQGFTINEFSKHHIGPVILREETHFLREVGPNDAFTIHLSISAISKNGKRFCFVHNLFRKDATQVAVVVAEGGWLDLKRRRLTLPPPKLFNIIQDIPRTKDFKFYDEDSEPQ